MLAAFRLLQADVDAGQEVPFALDEGSRGGGPSLYNWRPLFGSYVAERADALAALPDGRAALDALRTEPALTAFVRERQPALTDLDSALRDTVLLPLVVATADACGGFDLDDAALERLLVRLERAAVAERTTYAALAPLVGIEAAPDGVDSASASCSSASARAGWPRTGPSARDCCPRASCASPTAATRSSSRRPCPVARTPRCRTPPAPSRAW